MLRCAHMKWRFSNPIIGKVCATKAGSDISAQSRSRLCARFVDKLAKGKWDARIGSYGQHRRPEAHSNWPLWSMPQNSGECYLTVMANTAGPMARFENLL